jgi:hypothetical protein
MLADVSPAGSGDRSNPIRAALPPPIFRVVALPKFCPGLAELM